MILKQTFMKRSIQLIFLLISIISFVSCGGSDITPPNGNGNTKPGTEDPLNIVEMTGRSIGLAQISANPSLDENEYIEMSEILVFEDKDNKDKLLFTFNKPEIAFGQTEASSFKFANDEYTFHLASYKPAVTVFEDNKVPSYIKNIYPKEIIAKVELGQFVCKEGGKYNTKTKVFSMTYSSDIILYLAGKDKPITGISLDIEYGKSIK